ncbi:PREDICTED: uncharacterized protein LOC109148664 [Ipomoea nil]|uniref:uncharacterized protein LOC109148664 n=1 Tax=Ipomoea nil TaxID=35883 RepID=UPI000900C454|nr:PREDICTED: uncharacterized protein LOC109148664 [Ipomoea nil]
MVVGATINSSYLWRNCKVLRLTKNLRLQSLASNKDRQTVDWFSRWIADRDGITGFVNNGLFEIDILPRFMLKCGTNPIATIVESIFPTANYGMLEESHLEGRAILSPTLDVVDQINQYMCDMNTAEGRTYLSCDSLCKAESDDDNLSQVHTPEFLNGLRLSGLPNHSLTIKVGAPVMLLRNIEHSLGLCNVQVPT